MLRTKPFRPAVMAWAVLRCLLFVHLASAQQPASVRPPLTLGEISKGFESLAERVSPAVVQIVSSGYAPVRGADPMSAMLAKQRSSGSGVILGSDGYIMTNAHVVDGARRLQVLLASPVVGPDPQRSILKPRAKLRDAKLIGLDRETDLAVLKIEEQNLPFLELGDSEDLRQGQIVFAFGSPLGLENSVSMGIVSSVARQLDPDATMIYIQTDTAINPGNSGGPLVNADGKVMGINTMIFSRSGGNEGLGFACPSNIVRTVYEQIRVTGRVRRGEIGIHPQTINPLLTAGLGLSQDWGVVLGDVEPGGPAEIAGLKVGDIVVKMDGKIMENSRQFLVNLYQRMIGDVVRLEVLRGSEKLSVDVAVLERSDDPERFLRMVSREQNQIEKLGVLGIGLDREIRHMLPPLRGPAGVLIAALVADGPYWNELFQPGDVIYSVNDEPTPGLAELRGTLDRLKAGDPAVVQIERRARLMFVPLELE